MALQPSVDAVGFAGRGDLRRALALAVVLVLFAAILMLGGLALGVRGDGTTMLLLAILTMTIGFVPIISDQARSRNDRHLLFSFLALWFVVSFVVPVFANYLPSGETAIPGNVSSLVVSRDEIIDGQFMVVLGLSSLVIAYFSPIGRAVGRALPPARWDWPPGVLLAVAVGMLGIGMTMVLSGLLGINVRTLIGTGIAGTLGATTNYASVLLTIAVVRDRSRLALLLLCFALLMTLTLGFTSGSKMAILIGPAMVVLSLALYRRRLPLRWLVLGFVALILLYPVNIFYRAVVLSGQNPLYALLNLGTTLDRLLAFVGSASLGEYVAAGLMATGSRTDGLGVASVIIRDTPDSVPFQNGRTLWLFFVAFVPRILWSDKPSIPQGQWINEMYTPSLNLDTYFGPTAIGDFYLNFGALGVIGGMLFLGLVLRVAHELVIARAVTAPGILASIVILLQLVLRFESNVALVWSSAIFAIAPLVATHMVLRVLGLTIPARDPDAPVPPAPEPDRRATAARAQSAPS